MFESSLEQLHPSVIIEMISGICIFFFEISCSVSPNYLHWIASLTISGITKNDFS